MDQFITEPTISANKSNKYLGVFGMFWVTFLIIATFTASKTFSLGSFVFTVAILAYPFTYIFADIFTEVYGYRVTRKIVWTGFLCLVVSSFLSWLYSVIPPSSAFTNDEAFRSIFLQGPAIAVATIMGFFCGELANSYVLAKLKIITGGSHIWFRLVGSTLVGQLIDNTIFFTTAFLAAGFFTGTDLLSLVFPSVVFCTGWEIVALPFTRKFIVFIKRKEGLDVYDKGTNFNPFVV